VAGSRTSHGHRPFRIHLRQKPSSNLDPCQMASVAACGTMRSLCRKRLGFLHFCRRPPLASSQLQLHISILGADGTRLPDRPDHQSVGHLPRPLSSPASLEEPSKESDCKATDRKLFQVGARLLDGIKDPGFDR